MFYNKEFVYFITDNDAIKIGYSSRDIAYRIMELQTGNPRPLKLLGIIPCPFQTAYNKEQSLHKKYFQYLKVGGGTEWFENIPCIHAEYRKSVYDHELFLKMNNYINKLALYNTGINSHIFNWVKTKLVNLLPNVNKIVVIAPPKSGKRIMAQSCVLMYPHAKHIFITAQNKKDMSAQQSEHIGIGLVYISATNLSKEYDIIINRLKEELDRYDGEVIIHFDECDFGSSISNSSNVRSVHNRLLDIVGKKDNVKMISYSATPEEAIFEPANPDHILMYSPPISYVGPNYYIQNASDVEKFFIVDKSEFNFSSQGVDALKLLINSDKQFGVVRISYNENKKSLYSHLNNNKNKLLNIINNLGLNITPIFIDQSNSENYPWFYKEKAESSTNSKSGFWKNYSGKHLIIINHVAERGTEIGFHPDIAFWHEWAGPKTSYATISQRFGRVFYYKGYYDKEINKNYDPTDFRNEEVNIKLYCPLDALKAMNDAYCAKDGKQFKNIWTNAELERPIGNPKRISSSKDKIKQWEFNLIDIKENIDYKDYKDHGKAILTGNKATTNQRYIDAICKGTKPGTYSGNNIIMEILPSILSVQNDNKINQFLNDYPQIKEILVKGKVAYVFGKKNKLQLNLNTNSFKIKNSIHDNSFV